MEILACNKFTGRGRHVIRKERDNQIYGLHVYHPVMTNVPNVSETLMDCTPMRDESLKLNNIITCCWVVRNEVSLFRTLRSWLISLLKKGDVACTAASKLSKSKKFLRAY